jgi:hypothetical protein
MSAIEDKLARVTVAVTIATSTPVQEVKDDKILSTTVEYKSHKLIKEHSKTISLHIDAARPSIPLHLLWLTICDIVLANVRLAHPLCPRLGQGFVLWSLESARREGGSLVKTKHYVPFWPEGHAIVGRETEVPIIKR